MVSVRAESAAGNASYFGVRVASVGVRRKVIGIMSESKGVTSESVNARGKQWVLGR